MTEEEKRLSSEDDEDTTQFLAQEEDGLLEYALFRAVEEGNISKVMGLLEKNELNVNWQHKNEGNRSALHVAVQNGNSTLVALLLGRGAEVHLRDAYGQTPMNMIVEQERNETLNLVASKAISSLEETKLQLQQFGHEPIMQFRKGIGEATSPTRYLPSLPSPSMSPREDEIVEIPLARNTQKNFIVSGPQRRFGHRGDRRLNYNQYEGINNASNNNMTTMNSSATKKSVSGSHREDAAQPQTAGPSGRFEYPPGRRGDLAAVSADDLNSRLNHIFQNPTPTSKYQSHFPRNAAMSEMMKISHFKTVKNIFIAVLFVAIMNTIVYNYFEHGVILDLPLFFSFFRHFDHALLVWVVIFGISFLAPILEKGIVGGHLSARVAYCIYIIVTLVMVIAVPKYIRAWDFPPPTSAFVMCEFVRLWMKMHSYLMVNRSLRIEKKAGDNDPNVLLYPQNVTFENYFFFLWVPTLIYQISYPRTKKIRLSVVFKSLVETAGTVLYTYAIFARYCLPHSQEFNGDFKSLIFGIFKVMIPGCVVALMAFYGILHSWLNAWAELTRFADRQFYKDWWNATGWSQYYRKWNVVVHNFLHRHIFLECLVTLHLTKNSAMWVTFLLSAIAHEYIIACSLGFYKPILFMMFVIPGVLFIYLTEFFRGWNGWNIFMWAMLFIGHGMLYGLYSRAWYMHYYRDPSEEMSWWDAL